MSSEGAEPPPLAATLRLRPHPEGGWFAQTWRSDLTLPADALPPGYQGPRPVATAISYLLVPGERSSWHRVRSAELWLWQGGGPLRLMLGGTGDRPAPERVVLVGPVGEGRNDPEHALQQIVAPGEWQAAEPAGEQEVLVACIVAPGFDWQDFEIA